MGFASCSFFLSFFDEVCYVFGANRGKSFTGKRAFAYGCGSAYFPFRVGKAWDIFSFKVFKGFIEGGIFGFGA